ncbi:MAG: response regulator transcription factor [Flavobacteriales bacterium]|nr:response regulator transcription factor [Bacteroidota bacterium]MCB9240769.1 response regulator transcription factor [Flavobacteriales bacterium]
MKTIRAVVIDDEIKSREVIKALLENFCEGVEVVAEAGDIQESLRVLNQYKPDLVFLDITLKEGDSFQILAQLDSIDFDIIFVTAYDEYSVRALKFSGITCLFKPLDIDELQSAVKKVTRRSTDIGLAYEMVNDILTSRFTRIPIITTSGLRFADVVEIAYIMQCEEGVEVHFRSGEVMKSQRTLDAFADVIMNPNFIKMGKRLLVNKAHIDFKSKSDKKLRIRNGDVLELSSDELKVLAEQMA